MNMPRRNILLTLKVDKSDSEINNKFGSAFINVESKARSFVVMHYILTSLKVKERNGMPKYNKSHTIVS